MPGTGREVFSDSCGSKTNLDCDYIFPIDLALNGIQFGAKSIGRVQLQSKFGLDPQETEKISLRVPGILLKRKFCRGSVPKTDYLYTPNILIPTI